MLFLISVDAAALLIVDRSRPFTMATLQITDSKTFVANSNVFNEHSLIKDIDIPVVENETVSNKPLKYVCTDCDKSSLFFTDNINSLEHTKRTSSKYYFSVIKRLIASFTNFFYNHVVIITSDREKRKSTSTRETFDTEVSSRNECFGIKPNQIGVCFSCGFYCFASSIESELSYLSTKLIEKDLLSKWSPEYWQTMGSLLGCLISGISLCYIGRRTSLQRVAVPVLILAYIMMFVSVNTLKSSSWFMFIATSQIFIKSVSQSLSIIIPTIYILETACWQPGSYDSRAIAILVTLTQLPQAVASLFTSFGVITLDEGFRGTPILLIIFILLMLKTSPESPRWTLQAKNKVCEASNVLKELWPGKLLRNDIDKEIINMQREMEGTTSVCTPHSYIRPLLVLSCFLLLSQSVGFGAFHFYTGWAYKLAGLTTDYKITISVIRLISMCILTLITSLSVGPKCTSIILLISTPLLMVCLLTFGIFTYGLEQGSIEMNELALCPVALLITYEIGYWCGIGTLAVPVSALIIPPKSRPIMLTIGVIIYQIASYFCDIFLPLMFNVLHPYGVFWFHAFLTGVTLMYISFVIVPELKYTATSFKKEETTDIA